MSPYFYCLSFIVVQDEDLLWWYRRMREDPLLRDLANEENA